MTVAVPCPEAGDSSVIQLACDDALHAHSGCAVTAKAPAPPSATIIAGEATVSWHFDGVGDVIVTTDVEPSHPATASATAVTIDSTQVCRRKEAVGTSVGREEGLSGIVASQRSACAGRLVHTVRQHSAGTLASLIVLDAHVMQFVGSFFKGSALARPS